MNNLNKWNSIWKFGTFEKKYPDKEIQDFEKFHLPKKNKKKFQNFRYWIWKRCTYKFFI